jgi:HTH-type transcriptional regulator / antitoxin HipB
MIRELREARRLSQRELAERMGTTQSMVGRLEAGGSRPTLATLERVAAALGLRLEIRFAARRRSGEPHRKPVAVRPG